MQQEVTQVFPETLARKIRLLALDFDGVFTDNAVYVNEDGSESVRCSRGDGIGLQRLRSAGVNLVIISSEKNPVVTARSKKLNIQCMQGITDKRIALDAAVHKMRITLDQVAFVGNDINDLSCLESVGFPIVVRDSHPDVLPIAAFWTRAKGGNGAVREICDLFLKALKFNVEH